MSPCGVPLSVLIASLAVAAAAAPDERDPAESGRIKVRAESYEQTSLGHIEARGLVDLRMSDIRIQADKADVTEEKQPGGSARQRIVAEGNVVFIRGEERLSGDRLEMDASGKGVLTNAVGYLEPGVFVKARQIERLDADSYRVVGGTFTSCAQPNPRWSFSASRARVDVGDKITGAHAVFKVKSVPTFYLPFVYYPIGKDQRSTGFLLPSMGYSEARGFNLTTGFFWAMGRSMDQTFSFDYYSKAGYGVGHELRWVGSTPSRGTLRSVFFDLKSSSQYNYGLDWSVLQQLPGKLHASASVELSSSVAFTQRYASDSARGARSRDWSLSLERDFGPATLSAYAEATDGGSEGSVDGRMPGISLRRFPRPTWGGLVFDLKGSAERIRSGTRNRVDTWTRYDLAPTLSRPLRLSFLEVEPSLGYRYTRYGASVLPDDKGKPSRDQNGELMRDGPPLERSFFEAALDVRGPTFARVFDTPGLGYADRFKHTIGPEITWSYRTPLAASLTLPPSGEPERLAGGGRVDYALVQRFYAKRRGPSGKAMPYELLSWRLTQPYDVQPAAGRSGHLGPIESSLTLRPGADCQLDSTLKYDVSLRQLRSSIVSMSARRPGFSLTATWARTPNRADGPTMRPAADVTPRGSETLGARVALDLLPRRLALESMIDYDVALRRLWQVRGLVRYSTQCCGFTVGYDWRRLDTGPVEAKWHFSVELANVGSIGVPLPFR